MTRFGPLYQAHVECSTECRCSRLGRCRGNATCAMSLIAGRSRDSTSCCIYRSRHCDSDSKRAFRRGVVYGISRPVSSLTGPGPYATVVFCSIQSRVDSYLDRVRAASSSRSQSSILRRVVSGHCRNNEWCCPSGDGNCSRWLLPGTDNVALYWDRWRNALATAPTGHWACLT